MKERATIRPVILWEEEISELRKLLKNSSIKTPRRKLLNMSLPMMLPRHSPGLCSIKVDDKLVNSSGREVTADNITPPIKAPDKLVCLSRIYIFGCQVRRKDDGGSKDYINDINHGMKKILS